MKPQPEWMLITDVDGTLTGDDSALRELVYNAPAHGVALVPNSSRPLKSLHRTWSDLDLTSFPAQVGALGTEVEIEGEATSWRSHLPSFDRRPFDRLLSQLGFSTNGDEFQTELKASFTVPRTDWERVTEEVEKLGEVDIILSGEHDLDVIPRGAGKHAPLQFLANALSIPGERVIAAGDSMNDLSLLQAAHRRVVVANADSELRSAVAGLAFNAEEPHAAGLIEALRQWGIWP